MKAALPLFGEDSLALEDQARSVLHLLLDSSTSTDQTVVSDEGSLGCANCDQPVENLASPYCSEICKAQAAFVRQFRAALSTGLILSSEKQVVFGERLWWLLGGGLPIRESRIPESAKRQVIKRSGGKCEYCGSVMTSVENFGSGCNRPLHLRAVCADCSNTKPFVDLAFSQSPPVVTIFRDLGRRVFGSTPVRLCDDPDHWDWRAYMVQRRR